MSAMLILLLLVGIQLACCAPTPAAPPGSSVMQAVMAPVQGGDSNGGSSSPCCATLAASGLNPASPGGLPLVLINTQGRPIPDHRHIPASLCTCGSPDGQEFNGQVLIEIRGSSSAREATKKSFSFAVVSSHGSGDGGGGGGGIGGSSGSNSGSPGSSGLGSGSSDVDAGNRTLGEHRVAAQRHGGRRRQRRATLEVQEADDSSDEGSESGGPSKKDGSVFMGFPAGKHFVLYGPENDRTMGMRNVLAMWTAHQMGRYASRTQYCEVVLVQDGKPVSPDHYWGVYVAMEKIERGPSRVDVHTLKPHLADPDGPGSGSESGSEAPADALTAAMQQLQGVTPPPTSASAPTSSGRRLRMRTGVGVTPSTTPATPVPSMHTTDANTAAARASPSPASGRRRRSMRQGEAVTLPTGPAAPPMAPTPAAPGGASSRRLSIHAKGHTESNKTSDITGGYIVRYEHGKTKNDTVSFTAQLDLPGMQALSPAVTSAARPLPFILMYPGLHSKQWTRGKGGEEGETEAQARRRLARQRKLVLNYIGGYMGAVEVSFVAASQQPTPAPPSDTSSLSSAPSSPSLSAAAAAAAAGAWRSLVDEAAFIDYWIGTEVSKNPDGYRGSVYMSKDRGGKLALGPMWDYNEAFGLCCGFPIQGYDHAGASNGTSGGSAISPEGWRFNICQQQERCVADPVDGISPWFRAAWKDPAFRSAAARRWSGLRASALSDTAIRVQVANLTSTIHDAAMRNYKRWSAVLSAPGFSSDEAQFRHSVTELLTWLLAHVQWMDRALAAQAGGTGVTAAAQAQP